MQKITEIINSINQNFKNFNSNVFDELDDVLKNNPFKKNKEFYYSQIKQSYWVYNYLVKSEHLSSFEKAVLQMNFIKYIKHDLNYMNYNVNWNNYENIIIQQKAKFIMENEMQYEVISEVENIIEDGFVFANEKVKFEFLKFIFSNQVTPWFFTCLKDRIKFECFKQIEGLNKKAKIFLFNKILKTKDQTTIFNLMSLNDFYEEIKNKKGKNFLIFELLKNNLCHKSLIEKIDMDKLNKQGESFLFYMNDSVLSKDGIEGILEDRLNQLKKENLNSLVYQVNNKNESVIEILIKNKNIETIKFLMNNGYSVDKDANQLKILSLLEGMEDQVWQELLKVWQIQINYLKVSEICKSKYSEIEKIFKI